MNRRRRGYERLLHWYPRAWRSRWADVVVGTFEEDDAHRGITGPSVRQAWSIRAGGAVERLSTATVGLGISAMTASVIGATSILVASTLPALTAPLGLLSILAGPALAVFCALGLLARSGVLEVRAVLASAFPAVLALLLNAASAASWSVGFDEADAGRPQSLLARLLLPLLLTTWVVGTAALMPLFLRLTRGIPHPAPRFVVALCAAGIAALGTGIGLIVPMSAALGSAVVLFLALRSHRSGHPASSGRALDRADTAIGSHWPMRTLVSLATASAVLGVAALALAFTGSFWPASSLDGTAAMNLGLAVAALTAIPLVVAAGHLLRHHRRYRRSIAPALIAAALLTSGAAQAVGASAELQWPFLLVAAALIGAAAASLLYPALPLTEGLRVGVAALAAATATVTLGVVAAVLLPVLAPFAALTFLAVRAVRVRHGRTATSRLPTV